MANQKVESAFHEVFTNKPRTVDTSKSAIGQHKQMVAIALSKAGRSNSMKKGLSKLSHSR
jgi:hypothetical protein